MKKATKLLLICCAISIQTFSQGDGPRTMFLAPKNINLATPAFLSLSSNFNFAQDILIEDADVRSNIVPVTYIRYFGIAGRFAQVWVTPVWGNINGSVISGEKTVSIPTVNGFADPLIAMRIGLIGAPSLSIEEFKTHKQKFQVYFYAGTSIPIGNYKQSRPINLGTNRWAIRLAVPMVLPFGKNFKRPFFLEMTPSLMLYTKNNSPFDATERTQDPLFVFETHLSKNLTDKFWLSLDTRTQDGGTTTTDGSNDDNAIRQFSGTLSAGYQFFAPLGISLSYGRILISKKSKGEMIRVRLTMLF